MNTNHVLICFLLKHCVLLLLLKYFLEQLSDFYIHFNVLLALKITGSYRDVLSKSLSRILEILPVRQLTLLNVAALFLFKKVFRSLKKKVCVELNLFAGNRGIIHI